MNELLMYFLSNNEAAKRVCPHAGGTVRSDGFKISVMMPMQASNSNILLHKAPISDGL